MMDNVTHPPFSANITKTSNIDIFRVPIWFATGIPVINILLSLIIIGINGFCLIVLKRTKNVRSATRVFFMSLLLSNTFVGLGFVVPQSIIFRYGNKLGLDVSTHICKTVIGSGIVGAVACIISLLCINIERYISIEYPLRYYIWITRRNAMIAMIFKWIVVSCVVTLYTTQSFTGWDLGWNYKYYDPEWQMCLVLPEHFSSEKTTNAIGGIILVLTIIILPAVVTICIYARILTLVRRRLDAGISTTTNNQRSDKKAALTFTIVTISFVVQLLPFCAINLFRLTEEDNLCPQLEIIAYVALSSIFWLTAVIYVSRATSFRKRLAEMCVCVKLKA